MQAGRSAFSLAGRSRESLCLTSPFIERGPKKPLRPIDNDRRQCAELPDAVVRHVYDIDIAVSVHCYSTMAELAISCAGAPLGEHHATGRELPDQICLIIERIDDA